MYPYVMKYGEFPVGPPRLVVVKELPPGFLPAFPWTRPEDNPFRGLMLCKVMAPRAMQPPQLPPLLPYISQGKLFFPLCARCADDRRVQQGCPHTVEQRSWVSGFTHLEVNRALQLGYQLLDVYEVE
jgi:hypothetical protein